MIKYNHPMRIKYDKFKGEIAVKREEFDKYYKNVKPVELDSETVERLRPLVDVEDEWAGDVLISREKAVYDIECFFELLKYCYAGYLYYADKIDFDGIEKELISSVPNDGINAVGLRNALYTALEPYINDTHFAFLGDGGKSFAKPYRAFFTGLTVEANEEGFFVVESEIENVAKGTVFSAEELDGYLFKTFPSANGRDRYLVGVFTSDRPETISIGELSLPLHRCRIDSVREDPNKVGAWSLWTWNGINLVNHTGYGNEEVENTRRAFGTKEDEDPYYEMGEELRDDPALMWSLLGNSGGNSVYPQSFINGLNGYALWENDCAILCNPMLDPDMTEKAARCETYCSEHIDHRKAKYAGHLFVLQNCGVASSGESAVMFGRSVKNAYFAGSATSGCGQFGDIRRYRLLNSGICFVMGYKVFNMDGFEEGRGFAPDYWIDDDSPFGIIEEYIRMKGLDLAGDEWKTEIRERISSDLNKLMCDLSAYTEKGGISEKEKARLGSLLEEIRGEFERI